MDFDGLEMEFEFEGFWMFLDRWWIDLVGF